MLIPDLNLLICAYNTGAPHHEGAKAWWEETLSGASRVGLTWVVMTGFLRLMTSRGVTAEPVDPREVVETIRSWLRRPCCNVVGPGPGHIDLVQALVAETGAAGPLTTDIHLAAIALELRGTLCSNDRDFLRFSGLKLVDPLR